MSLFDCKITPTKIDIISSPGASRRDGHLFIPASFYTCLKGDRQELILKLLNKGKGMGASSGEITR